jgi:hypothetical protein
MTLAAYLSLVGFKYELERDGSTAAGHPIASWEFSGDGLAVEVKKFTDGAAMVEPDQFFREVRRIRGVLYDFLGLGASGGTADS